MPARDRPTRRRCETASRQRRSQLQLELGCFVTLVFGHGDFPNTPRHSRTLSFPPALLKTLTGLRGVVAANRLFGQQGFHGFGLSSHLPEPHSERTVGR